MQPCFDVTSIASRNFALLTSFPEAGYCIIFGQGCGPVTPLFGSWVPVVSIGGCAVLCVEMTLSSSTVTVSGGCCGVTARANPVGISGGVSNATNNKPCAVFVGAGAAKYVEASAPLEGSGSLAFSKGSVQFGAGAGAGAGVKCGVTRRFR